MKLNLLFTLKQVDLFLFISIIVVIVLFFLILFVSAIIQRKRYAKADDEKMRIFNERLSKIKDNETKILNKKNGKKKVTEFGYFVLEENGLWVEVLEEEYNELPYEEIGDVDLEEPTEDDNVLIEPEAKTQNIVFIEEEVDKTLVVEEKPSKVEEKQEVENKVTKVVEKSKVETKTLKAEEKSVKVVEKSKVENKVVKAEEKPAKVVEKSKVETKAVKAEEKPVKVVEKSKVETKDVKAEEKPVKVVEKSKVETKTVKAGEKPVKVVEKSKVETKAAETKKVAPAPVKVEDSNRYNGKFEVFFEEGYYRYRLKASNGQILFESELYQSQQSATKSIESVRRNIENDGIVRIIRDKRDKYKFVLRTKNHRILAIGANYSSEKAAYSAFESLKRFGVKADIEVIDEEPKNERITSLEEARLEVIEDKITGKVEILRDNDGEYSWFLKANNGEILAGNEGYTSKEGCMNAISVFRNSVVNGKFYIIKDKNALYQYKLYSSDGRFICVGESYTTKSQANSSVNSVRSFIKYADIVEV